MHNPVTLGQMIVMQKERKIENYDRQERKKKGNYRKHPLKKHKLQSKNERPD